MRGTRLPAGTYRARKGRVAEAIALWQDVFSRNPALVSVGVNLALAQLDAGDNGGAKIW
jgi:hypothetical protein